MTDPDDPADPASLAAIPDDPLVYAMNCLDRVRRSAARMAESKLAMDEEMASGRAKRAFNAAQLGSWVALISIAGDLRRLADLAEAGTDPPPALHLVPPP